jgi:hypothetical protein
MELRRLFFLVDSAAPALDQRPSRRALLFQIGTGFSSGNSANGTSTQPNSTNVFNTLLITIADKLEVLNSGGTMTSSNRTKEFQGGSRHSIATRTGMEGNAEEGLFIQLL